jgi:hypothetical protein
MYKAFGRALSVPYTVRTQARIGLSSMCVHILFANHHMTCAIYVRAHNGGKIDHDQCARTYTMQTSFQVWRAAFFTDSFAAGASSPLTRHPR